MFFDISFNACDNMFFGVYNHVQKHEPDLEQILERSKKYNVIPFFVGTNLESSIKCYKYAQKYNTFSYIGLHPNNATTNKEDLPQIIDLILENDVDKINEEKAQTKPNDNSTKPISSKTDLSFFDFAIKNHFVAVGECGLDYYRTHATKEDQKHVFKALLDLNHKSYFVHSRGSHRDLVEILSDYKTKIVVHSFDGNIDEANELIKLGYYIGINGHSAKNAVDIIKNININRVMIESDAPYCNIGKTYDGYKYIQTHFDETKKYDINKIYKKRNEPCKTIQVAEIIANIRNNDLACIKQTLRKNTQDFYDIEKLQS